MHCGYVVRVEKLRPHSNADRLQIATFFGSDTSVSLDVCLGDIGVYFPVDLQLSEEYCKVNNLVRRKDENGNNVGGFLDPDKRNIRAINLRGEKSDGLYMPLSSLNYCFDDLAAVHFNVGDQITIVNQHEICNKYIPARKSYTGGKVNRKSNKTRRHKDPYSPLFAEHADTEQLAYNLDAFHSGDRVNITLKMHGTSQRTGYLPVLRGYKRTLLDRLLRRPGQPIYDYDYVSGTRRVVLEDFNKEGFYGDNKFRQKHHDALVGKLNKGETLYYEVVGFTDTGAPIMSVCDNSKLGKDFVKQYGKTTTFNYECHADGKVIKYGYDDVGEFQIEGAAPQSEMYAYRMTMTTPDGVVIEYPPELLRERCEHMGIKVVPQLTEVIIPEDISVSPGEYIQQLADKYNDGADPIGKTHIREGVVCRIANRTKFTAFKSKNWNFKVLEGIAKNDAIAPDMEEAQET